MELREVALADPVVDVLIPLHDRDLTQPVGMIHAKPSPAGTQPAYYLRLLYHGIEAFFSMPPAQSDQRCRDGLYRR